MKLDEFLKLLKGVKPSSNGQYMALCPGHDDQKASLSIKSDNDKILLHCHAGCATADIMAGLGLTMNDLYLSKHNTMSGQKQIEAVYKYIDTNGKSFEVVRTKPKGFYQRQPDGKGGYINNLKGIAPSLYRQDKLQQAIKNSIPIIFVEGEKDVDRLQKLELVATTNPMGAGKWRDNYTEALQGADLVIIPDNDEPGLAHANRIANSCHGKASRIRILKLPEKGKDVSDWLDNGGNRKELDRLITESQEWKPSLDNSDIGLVCMADVKAEEVEWLWYPYIPIGKITMLEGDPGVGKSWVSLAIAKAVSLGKGLYGMNTTAPAKVVLASAEDGLRDTLRPRLDILKANVENVHAIKHPLDFKNGDLIKLIACIEQVNPVLLIIDPLVAYIGAGVDLHRANETRAIMAQLADIAEKYHVAIVAIRHLAKGGTMKAIYRGLGSIDLTAACRSVLMIGCDSEDNQKRGVVQIKSNLAPMGKAIGYELKEGEFHWTGESDLTSERILSAENNENKSKFDEAVDFLKDVLADGQRDAAEILEEAKDAGLSEKTIRRTKKELKVISRRHGEKEKKGGGKFTWELPENDLDGQDCHSKEFDHLNNSTPEVDCSSKYNGQHKPNSQSEINFNNTNKLQQSVEASINPVDVKKPGYINQSNFQSDSDSKKFGHLNTDEPILGMPNEEAVEIWRSQGSPLIPLKPGESLIDLEKFLIQTNIKPFELKTIEVWLKKYAPDKLLGNQQSLPPPN